MKLTRPTAIPVCGLPLVGKTTIAKGLARRLGIYHRDIDNDIRFKLFWRPPVQADLSERGIAREREEMLSAYRNLICLTEEFLRLGESIIITATFSRDLYWDMIRRVMNKEPNAALKVVLCRINDTSDEELWRRIKARGNHTVNSPAHFREVEARYINPLPVKYLPLDTSSPDAIEANVEKAMAYILE